MKYFFLTFALALCILCQPTNAKTTQLTIALKDGSTVILDLTAGGNEDDRQLPVMYLTPTSVKVTLPPKTATEPGGAATAAKTYEFEVENLSSMETVDPQSSSINSIERASGDLEVTYRGGNLIHLSGKAEITPNNVKVYDITGKLQEVEITEDGDGVTISLANLPTGVYVLNSGLTSIKIAKK